MNSLQDLVFQCKVCHKTMQTQEMDRHLSDTCTELPAKCPYNPLHEVKLSGMLEHLKTCEESDVFCKVCFTTLKFTEITSHSITRGCLKRLKSRIYEIPPNAEIEVTKKENCTDSDAEKMIKIVQKGWNFNDIRSETNELNDNVEQVWENASVMVKL